MDISVLVPKVHRWCTCQCHRWCVYICFSIGGRCTDGVFHYQGDRLPEGVCMFYQEKGFQMV